VNKNLLFAMAMHEALRLYGLSYVVDPTSPYASSSQDLARVDFLQFPQQTLEYKSGDCDDLSILYCALLESVGVPTAFITVPGHIYMAIGLSMQPDAARTAFVRPDDLIYQGEETWLPIEVTLRDQDFLAAWEQGAKQWRENQGRQQAGFLANRDSWQVYEPTGFSGSALSLALPAEAQLREVVVAEAIRFVDREISAQVARLQAEVRRQQSSARSVNQLGVLYARYGLYDRAQEEFRKVVDKEEYVPALLNLGSILKLAGDAKGALDCYERAYRKEPDRPTVLLAMARLNHELENYGLVREVYGKLKERDPQLAQQYAYLDLRGEEAQRALQLSELEGAVLWTSEAPVRNPPDCGHRTCARRVPARGPAAHHRGDRGARHATACADRLGGHGAFVHGDRAHMDRQLQQRARLPA